MKDNWINHNTDKLLLYSLVILGGIFMLHIVHHASGDQQLLTWLENAFSTVLGALILILTGRIARAGDGGGNGGNGNGGGIVQAPVVVPVPVNPQGLTGVAGATASLGTNSGHPGTSAPH